MEFLTQYLYAHVNSLFIKTFAFFFRVFKGFVTMIALAVDVLGYDQTLDQASWCWIDPRVQNALFWQFFTGKFWEMLSYVLIVVLYTTVSCYIWKMVRFIIV